MFVATANTMNIPPALLDRMEVIRLSGYTEDEKINIAQRYLLPKQMKNNGLKAERDRGLRERVRDIIRYYTREAGVRCARARDLQDLPQGGEGAAAQEARRSKVAVTARRTSTSTLACAAITFGMAEKRTRSARSPGSRGPKSAATC